MDGKIHHFWSLLFASVLLSALTFAYNDNVWIFTGSIALILFSIFTHSRERIAGHNVSERKELLKKDDVNNPEKIAKKIDQSKEWNARWQKLSWSSIYLTTAYTIGFAEYIDGVPQITSVALSFLSVMLSVAGAYIADIDFNWGIEEHRNPLTHSWVIGLLCFTLSMVGIGYSMRYVILLPAMFCMGYASHLFLDCVPITTVGGIAIFKEFFNFKNAPGDIRFIPEKWEHFWLFFSGVIMAICFAVSIPRLYGTHGFDYDVVDDANGRLIWTNEMIASAIIGVVGIVIWIGLYIFTRFTKFKEGFEKKVKKKEKEKKVESIKKDEKAYEKQKKKILSVFDDKALYPSKKDLAEAIQQKIDDKKVNVDNIIDQLKENGLIEYQTSPRGYRKV